MGTRLLSRLFSENSRLARVVRPAELVGIPVLAALAYLVFIPWDPPAFPSALREPMPVRPLGIVGLVLVLLALAAHLGFWGRPLWWAPVLVGVAPAGLLLAFFLWSPPQVATRWPVVLWVGLTWMILSDVTACAMVARSLGDRFRPRPAPLSPE